MHLSKASGGTPKIVNRSSYNKIPEELRELCDDIEKIAKEVYPDVLSINWHGSIPRGDFVFGESDADITIFITGEFKDGHRGKREKMLQDILPKWRNQGIFKLDVMAVPKTQFHDDFRRNALFFCESDGIFLPRYPELDFSHTIPDTNLELITILNRYFKLWIRDAKDDIKELTKEQIYKQVWKRTYRAIYALAILDGAPYEQNWRSYPELIKKHVPKHSKKIDKLLKEGIDLDEILQIGRQVAQELEQQGIIFRASWN